MNCDNSLTQGVGVLHLDPKFELVLLQGIVEEGGKPPLRYFHLHMLVQGRQLKCNQGSYLRATRNQLGQEILLCQKILINILRISLSFRGYVGGV